MSIEASASEAALLRLWSHTVGVVNRVRTGGTDPVSGQPGDEERTGTGVAGVWGQHHFILTAEHVLEGAQPGDLRFYCRPKGGLKYQHAADVTMQDAVEPVPLGEHNSTIHRCGWEDLALVTTVPKAVGPHVEFFDIANSWADPLEGEPVAGLGFPISNSVLVETKQVGPITQKTLALSPTPFSGEVMPCPSEDDRKFKVTKFDPDRHYLIPYEPANQGKHPRGISGAATWVESSAQHVVWAPRYKFGGICTVCYKSGTVEQVVKASVVRLFLEEVLGSG